MRFLLAALVFVFLAGCSVEGVVEAKAIIPSHYTTATQCTPIDKTVMCLPTVLFVPTRYYLIGDEWEWAVDKEVYLRYDVGDYFSSEE